MKTAQPDEHGHFVVIGGGAAGFFAALQCRLQNPALPVTILEAAPKPLGKVKISGGGRCNVTHACFDVASLVQYYPRGQRELKGIFSRFGPKDTVNWFESHGVPLKTEADGRMFPTTDQSQTIIDCLVDTARQLGIELKTRAAVQSISHEAGWFRINTREQSVRATHVLLATGSSAKGLEWARQFQHQMIPSVPSLFTFVIDDPKLRDLSGIRFDQVVGYLEVSGHKPIVQQGDLLITHWGLSGPVILRLSAWGARPLFEQQYQASLKIDFAPQLDHQQVQQRLLQQKQQAAKKWVGNDNPVELPKRFWLRLLALENVAEDCLWSAVPNKALNRLSELIKRCPFTISGKGEFKDEFVTAGGVPLSEVDLKTMESRLQPNLFFAGEIIDVDGLTGGFNFQNAWSTGWLAGESVAQKTRSLSGSVY